MTAEAPELAPYARDLAAATARHDTAEALLYDAERRPLHRPDVHAEKVATIAEQRAAAAAPILERARAEAAALLAEAQRLEGALPADPVLGLAGDELARASSLRAFIAEDAERLDLDALAGRVRSAIATGDRPALALLSRYGGQRIDALDVRTLGDIDRDALRDLRDALGEAAEALITPEQRTARARANDARRRAATVEQWARNVDPARAEELRQRFPALARRAS